MFNPGLTQAELRKYQAALCSESRIVRTSLDVLNLDGETLHGLDHKINDGQVDIDSTTWPTRTMMVDLVDPDNTINLDESRMLRCWYDVLVDDIGWVRCPLITGPVVKLDWSDGIAKVEVHGKERFHLSPAFVPFTVRKRTRKTDAIKTILGRGGETRFDIPDLDGRMPASLSVAAQDPRWQKADKIARSMARLLFYDGRGVATVRRRGQNVVFTFRDGDNGSVMTLPQVTRSRDRVINAVRVKGGFPKGLEKAAADSDKKLKESERVRYTLVAPRSHWLSPWRIGLGNKPLYLPEFVDNDQIRSKAEATNVADEHLEDGLRAEIDVTFTSVPIPHLEEGDLVRVSTEPTAESFRFEKASIPLKHDGQMTVGYNELVSRPGRRNVK